MQRRLSSSIGFKVALGYGIIILCITLVAVYSLISLKESRVIDQRVTDQYLPMLNQLNRLNTLNTNSRKLTNSWIYNPNVQDKAELELIFNKEAPELISISRTLAEGVQDFDSILYFLDALEQNLILQKRVTSLLQTPDDYENPEKLFEAVPLFDDEVVPGNMLIANGFMSLSDSVQSKSDAMVQEKYRSFDSVERIFILLATIALLIGVLASYYSIRTVVSPIRMVTDLLHEMGKGKLPEIRDSRGTDEISQMISSLMILRSSLYKAAKFAEEIGVGNLNLDFQVLGEEDAMGLALEKMRDNLRQVIEETNEVVQQAVEDGNLITSIKEEGKEGAWLQQASSINQLLTSIREPLFGLGEVINALSQGDLTKNYEGDEKGQIEEVTLALNNAINNLNVLLHQILEASDSVEEASNVMSMNAVELNSTTGEIAQSIGEMSNGAQTQLNKVDESFQLLENTLRKAKEMADKSKSIHLAAKVGSENSERGNELMAEVNKSIENISQFSAHTEAAMKILQNRSNKISEVLSTISEIANQTNLLALNAAIEAAQAGDAGRGFSVVAEEIRKLAEESRSSANSIDQLITDIQEDINNTAKNMDDMRASVKMGVSASERASQSFQDITTSSVQTLNESEEIMKAIGQQEQDLSTVVTLTEAVVVVAEQTAAGTEEAASSSSEFASGMENYKNKSEGLREVAKFLKDQVSKFSLKSK